MSDNEITIPLTAWASARLNLYLFLSSETDDDALARHGVLAPAATGRTLMDDLLDVLWGRRERIRAAKLATDPNWSALNRPMRLTVRPSD